ncbi:dienelactone hydrolase endo-1,3,1,4-beta-D-glucanase [Agrocybe pediades]|nr:dienelactone hydrolase endo-1,3,1,4-beta-D-glucanase [Agrocybe pediades]
MSCPDCAKGHILEGEPKGSIENEFQGAYFAPSATGSPSKRAVLLFTDAFGLPLKNCKIMADEMAKRLECDVWIPDYFNGQPLLDLDSLKLPERPGQKLSIMDWINFILVAIPKIPNYIRNRPSVVDMRIESFINLIKEKKKYEKIGSVGYCFGGSACVRIASTGLVDTVVIVHPGRLRIEQVKAMKVPASWACAEEDFNFSNELRDQCEAELASRKGKDNFVEYEFKIWKGTQHGFGSRPNMTIPEIKEAFEGAFEQAIAWFNKTLVV